MTVTTETDLSMTSQPPQGTEVLIVGAGPTGLILALWLVKAGVRCRLIEKNNQPGEASRAMAVQARILEYYHQLGIVEPVIESGLKMERVTLHVQQQTVAQVFLGNIGQDLSPYPYVLSYPQDDHEKFLVQQLQTAGGKVEWNTELITFRQNRDGVWATLRTDNGEEEDVKVSFLCGCDGAHSRVRDVLGIDFLGGTYEQQFFVADVSARGQYVDGSIHICFGQEIFCAIFPVRSRDTIRLVGILPSNLSAENPKSLEAIPSEVLQLTGLEIEAVQWFSTYKVHHRVAEKFAVGRAFIAGDAGHVHSPAGGQGMNTGIGDAINLAWKLTSVLRNEAALDILESYEIERAAFARKLVETTDQAFSRIVGRNIQGSFMRLILFPLIAPVATRLTFFRQILFRILSQIRIEYRTSPLSFGKKGKTCPGDRLPWFPEVNNFEPLKSCDWQVHCYGAVPIELKNRLNQLGLPLHSFDWCPSAGKYGFKPGTVCLIRPDGHIAIADSSPSLDALHQYLSK